MQDLLTEGYDMCNHKRRGIVTNQNPAQPYDSRRAHASTVCCGRDECVAKDVSWAASKTNESAAYYSDAERGVSA